MSVPMIGPGPLEGGPKGSPGSAKTADGFSACLKEECAREAAPLEETAPSDRGDSAPQKSNPESKSVTSKNPSNRENCFHGQTKSGPCSRDGGPVTAGETPLSQQPDAENPNPIVDPGLEVLQAVLELIAVNVETSIPSQPSSEEVPGLTVVVPEPIVNSVDANAVTSDSDRPGGEKDSETDVPAPQKESVISSPLVSVPTPIPLIAVGVPLSVVVPDSNPAGSEENVKDAPIEDPTLVGPVSGPQRVSAADFVSPTAQNPGPNAEADASSKSIHTPTSAMESQTPVAATPKEEKSVADKSRRTPESDQLPLTNPNSVDRVSENPDRVDSQKPEIRVSQKTSSMAAGSVPMTAPKSPPPNPEQDATFRDALKAVSDATNSFKEAGAISLSRESVVSAPAIDKGAQVESARPAAPVPVLTPSPIELAKQIHVHLESGRSVVHVELHPEHLGEMNIALETKGKDVSMRFTVDNDSARHSVVAGLKELSGSLNTLGWTVNGLAVQVASGGVGNGRSDADGSRWAAFPVNANQVPVDQKTESRASPSGAWRVDLVA